MQDILDHFYTNTVGPYWDAERHYIDEAYQTIPFPFSEMASPSFSMDYQWAFEQLVGYINTWSAVKHYIKQVGRNPVDEIKEKLRNAWGQAVFTNVSFPVLLRIGY